MNATSESSRHYKMMYEMLTGSFHRISHVNRYSSIPVTRKENVAEHSWYVCFYAYLIGRDISAKGVTVDFGTLLARALIHDLDESLTGDFLRVVKYGHPDLKRALDEVSESMISSMQDKLGVELFSVWSSAKKNDLEGDIIKIVDLARVASYAWEEFKCGNSFMMPILRECYKYLQTVELSSEAAYLVTPYLTSIEEWMEYTAKPLWEMEE